MQLIFRNARIILEKKACRNTKSGGGVKLYIILRKLMNLRGYDFNIVDDMMAGSSLKLIHVEGQISSQESVFTEEA